MIQPGFVRLIEYTRGDWVEVAHDGAIAVVDAQGRVLAQAGDAWARSFTRSTIKPFQALPFVLGGGIEHFGFTPAQVALLCASHNGEAMHVEQVDAMLEKVKQPYQHLQCGCHVPLLYSYANTAQPVGLQFDERHNNCSGKHTGFLAYCMQHGLPIERHLQLDHPLQLAIREQLKRATGASDDELLVGTDGCSAPNYAMPLARLACGFARLAVSDTDQPERAGDLADALRQAMQALARAMREHPEMVSGTGRNDLDFTRAGRGDWITKIGADGVQVIASRSRGEAIAIKMISGHMPALYAAAVTAMDQRGWLDAAQREQLSSWAPRPIHNARGITTGHIRAAFSL
jgi:L-asparaginase II